MAIPLRVLTSSDDRPRFSMDSEAEAILAYALGKERRDSTASNTSDDDDEDEDDIEVRTTPLSGDDEEAFLKDHDPLTLDFEPRPFKRVKPSSPSFRSGTNFLGEIAKILPLCLDFHWLADSLLGGRSDRIHFKGILSASSCAGKSHCCCAKNNTRSGTLSLFAGINGEYLDAELSPKYQMLEWTMPLDGEDGAFLLRYAWTGIEVMVGSTGRLFGRMLMGRGKRFCMNVIFSTYISTVAVLMVACESKSAALRQLLDLWGRTVHPPLDRSSQSNSLLFTTSFLTLRTGDTPSLQSTLSTTSIPNPQFPSSPTTPTQKSISQYGPPQKQKSHTFTITTSTSGISLTSITG
jgi:hypothetical protein